MTRIALAHEWLSSRSGSEKTFEAMAAAFPEADLYALTVQPGVLFEFGGRRVLTTLLDRSRLLRERRALSLPLMPLAWSLQRTDSYDLVMTSSHACVKAFRPARRAVHLCYCHTPMRYAWLPEDDARARAAAGPVRIGLDAMRRWDRRSIRWVDDFAANSSVVRDRIRDFYDRDARVLHPPVNTEWFTPTPAAAARDYALAVSRFIPYKRLDLAIRACAKAQVPLVVAGSGPQEPQLRALAERLGSQVRFEIDVDDLRLRELYRGAALLVFPAYEDFGIVAVEAQACGTPVVALAAGGSLDTVVNGRTGALVGEQSADAFAAGIQWLLDDPPEPEVCRRHAQRFSHRQFSAGLHQWVADTGVDLPGALTARELLPTGP